MLFLLSCVTVGCRNKQEEASLEQQREQQYALNSHLLTEGLGFLVSSDSSNFFADRHLRDYYRDTTHTRLWTASLLPAQQAETLLQSLEEAVARVGFSTKAFGLDQVKQDIDSTRNLSLDSILPKHIERLARIEYLLTKAYLRFSAGQSFGFLDNPENYFNRLDVSERDSTGRAVAFRTLTKQHIAQPKADFAENALIQAANGQAVEFLRACEPKSPLYGQLVEQLAKVSENEARRRLVANMERARWQTSNRPGTTPTYVLVNTAAQQLWAVSPDTVLQMRVVCGARATKTPLMKGMLHSITVNPQWNIPANVVRNEISVHAGDSAYFARHNYFLPGKDDVKIHEVPREKLAACLYRVAQHRGPGNALGRLKFNFRNSFDVYLHDTNNPGAFGRADRALSHGCVRVQRPFDLACFLLKPNDEQQDRLRVAIGMTPESEKELQWLEENGDDKEAVLNHYHGGSISPNIPVYIIYFTVYPNPIDGKLQTWGDPYGYDKQLLKAIKPFM